MTYIVSAEDTHNLATAVELNQDALLEVLCEVRVGQFRSPWWTHLLEFWLCLRHFDYEDLSVTLERTLVTFEL